MVALAAAGGAVADDPARSATLYKTPDCGCCDGYADYLRGHGFDVVVKPTPDLSLLKRQNGVPQNLDGCHTTLVGGYVVEGHVPAGSVEKLLTERPPLRGISLPDMPEGSPGMSGVKRAPFTIYGFGDGSTAVFSVE
jgi:hypothetical protein